MTADSIIITPELLLNGYASGVFPMSDSADDPEIYWVDPNLRGIIPLDNFHISRSLVRRIKRAEYKITINKDFAGVVKGCSDRKETWINAEIFGLYIKLHEMGYAHSIEVMKENQLVGGVYGVALGGAFFGESMFSKATDASKVALAYLIARLNYGGFKLFDTQFITSHLASLGAIEVSRRTYRDALTKSMEYSGDFLKLSEDVQPSEVLQLNSHTS